MIRGTSAFRKRYKLASPGSIALAIRVYRAALTPLKLTIKDSASARWAGKFWMHET